MTQPNPSDPSAKPSERSPEGAGSMISPASDTSSKTRRAERLGTPGTQPTSTKRIASQAWDTVHEAGSYVCNETGRLLRVPASALGANHKPTTEFDEPQPNVTRLSSDPKSPIAELRTTCCTTDIKPRF